MADYSKYESVIGLEVHVQLQTESKLFAPDSATYGAEPNDHTSFITLAHPGTLPKINEKAVEFAVKLGYALNCEINPNNRFDRKNYFYPDLPKGYQVTQDAQPICLGGSVKIRLKSGDEKVIRIHHIHLEEDAGKSSHDQDSKYSMIDLNRAGVPLVEIVTEPDMRSGEETTLFLNEIRRIIDFLGVSDGNMEEGSLRCDTNISVRLRGTEKYNNRAEIKNMNSLKFIRKAIDFEFKRQIDCLENGEEIIQQTRGFDSAKGITLPQRDKEMAHDYRYFPEPDLCSIHLSDEYLESVKSQMPPLPNELFVKFTKEYQLSDYDSDNLIESLDFALYFEELAENCKNHKTAANWMLNSVKSYLNDSNIGIKDFNVPPKKLSELIVLVSDGKVGMQSAKQQLFDALVKNPEIEPFEQAKTLNLLLDTDSGFAEKVIDDILAKNPEQVKAYNNGKKNLIGMFMGLIMKDSKGKIPAKEAKNILEKKLIEKK